MKKKLVLFGGTGGLGEELGKKLEANYDVLSLGSKKLDITDKLAVDKFFHINDIDIVINMAAYNYDSFLHKYEYERYHEIDKQLNVNIKGNINILSSCLPYMKKKQYGRIIAASSVLSAAPVVGTSIYSSSKSFIETLYKTAALENATAGVTCNTIQLGYFDGGLVYKIPQEIREKIINGIPSKRLGTIEELYNTIELLINTPYINGSVIKINGGMN